MSGNKRSLWDRLRSFLRPPTETYGTRKPRPSGDIDSLGQQYEGRTDQRHHGGTGAIGGH